MNWGVGGGADEEPPISEREHGAAVPLLYGRQMRIPLHIHGHHPLGTRASAAGALP